MLKNLHFAQKSTFWSKIDILVKNQNFGHLRGAPIFSTMIKGASTVASTMGGIQIGNIIDPRFLQKNKDFLYDPNSLEKQDLDDDKSCAIADS